MRPMIAVVLAGVCALPAAGQRRPVYDASVVNQVRIDLRDLGYPPVDVIPSGESAIAALAVAPGGALWGVTTGKRSHLFTLAPRQGYVQPVGVLKGVSEVRNALVVAANGDVYVGAADAGGRLYRYTPGREDFAVTDLGAPASEGGIHALAIDRERGVIYGLTSPGAEFFSYRIAEARFATHGKVAERNIPGERFERHKNIGRAIGIDREGRVYASGENGAIFRYTPNQPEIRRLPLAAPTVPGREPYCGVDAWTLSQVGELYGGTSDGYLFRLDPEALKVENRGKPLNQYRIRGLVWSPDGRLYGAGGDEGEMARLFSYDPATGVYEMLGMIDVNRRPYYSWQAYVIGAVAIGRDGTVYLGQSERISKLYLYYPEAR